MDGDPTWLERYSRQITLEPMAEEGQRRLREATVVVVGAGALGSNSADLLVRMGIGSVRIIDRDVVELSNLHRFRVLGEPHLDLSKADALGGELANSFPDASVAGVAEDLTAGNVLGLLEGADVVIDGLDNMGTRYIVNDACLELGIPWVYGGVVGTTGMEAPFPVDGPCLRCLFPEPPDPGVLPTCESAGIHPSTPAVVAAIQVAHASRILTGASVESRLTTMDLWSDYWRTVDLQRREDCPACSEGRREFLEAGSGEIATSLCGQDAVQINPPRRTSIDMDAKEREWASLGKVVRSGPVLTLDLGDLRLQLFPSGRALVKGTAEVAVAKTLYARYVGH
ncbi:MAG: ThiF family adenylyltransferase [Thermoplasmata archaeon]|nr:MAG: ThiF family adenylyltransferase [Thermoplasmata archaeon]